MTKLTKNSQMLMSFFLDKKCIKHTPNAKKTDVLLEQLYTDMMYADNFISSEKNKYGDSFYKLIITKISTISEIPKPKLFNADSFPTEVRNHIDENSIYNFSYTFSLFNRSIKVNFITEDPDSELKIDTYNKYVEKILVWLCIINEYSSKKCSKTLTIYIYLTSLYKQLPESNIHILDEINVNTAFTYTCPVVSEIVVFRKEEWFKVLMHETFHNFALDFSDMNISDCNEKILSIFKVNSEVNLFEAYTEFWAEIMNAVFCSFYLLKDRNDLKEFLKNCEFFINFERTFGFFQLVKALDFMGLKYKYLYSNDTLSVSMRKTLYKEKTNVLSYYILKMVLINNYQGFLSWCDTNNFSLMQFKKTISNLEEFCNFIEKNCKIPTMIDGISCMENLLESVKRVKSNKKKELDPFIVKNMRMSICELG